jgi:hypothetical protein
LQFAVEGVLVLDQVGSGLMQGHSWLDVEGGFARPQPRPGRPLFPAEGRKIGLLRHQVKGYRRSL